MLDLRPYRRPIRRLSYYLPWAGLIGPGVILNKDGAFQRTLGFRGADLDSSTPAELMGAAGRLNNVLRRFGSGWCLHVEARRAPAPHYPQSNWPNGLSWLIDAERRLVFEAQGARFESRYYFTMAWLPPAERQAKLEAVLFEGGEANELGVDYRAHLERFLEQPTPSPPSSKPCCPKRAGSMMKRR